MFGRRHFKVFGVFTIAVSILLVGLFLLETSGQQPQGGPSKILKQLKGHEDAIFSAAFSPDGRLIVTGSFDNTLKLWNAMTGEEIKTYGGPKGHKDFVLHASFSPDGRMIASTGIDKIINLWDVPLDEPLQEFAGHKDEVACLAMSTDGTKFATGSKDNTVRIWNRADGKLLFTLTGHTGGVSDVAFSADGKLLGSVADDHTLRLWNVEDGKAVGLVGVHSDRVSGLAFHPNNAAAYTASHDGTAKFWKLPLTATRGLEKPHAEKVTAMVLTPDGAKILSAGKSVQLSNFADGKQERVFEGAKAPITAVATNGTVVAAGLADNTVFVWNLADGKLQGQLYAHAGAITGLAIDAKGSTLLSTSTDGALKAWSLPLSPDRVVPHTDEVLAAVLSGDGKFLYTGLADKTARRWDVATSKFDKEFKGHADKVTAVAVSPNGQIFATGSADNTIRLFNVADGKLIDVLGAHQGAVQSLQFNDAGNQLLSSGEGGAVKLWALPTVAPKILAHTEQVTCAALSPDGSKLLTGTNGKDVKVQLWNLADGKVLKTFAGPKKDIVNVAFNANAQIVSAGTVDDQVFLWNDADAKLLGQLHAHAGAVGGIAFDPKGTSLFTAGADGALKQWLLPLGQNKQLTHPDAVLASALTADKSRLYTAGADKLVRAWDLKTDKEAIQFKGHTDAVGAVAVSADGKVLVSGSADSTIRLWNPADGKLIDLIGAHAGKVTSLQISNDGKQLLSAGEDGSLKLWGLPFAPAKVFAHTEAVTCAALSPDGTILITGTGGKDIKVQLWNFADGKVLKTFAGPKTAITRVAFSADGVKVAAGTTGNQVYVWTAADGKLLGQLHAHGKTVTGLVFDAKGTQLLSTSADGTLKQWLLPLQANQALTHADVVRDAVASPDKTRLYTAGADKMVHVWDLKSGKSVLQFKGHTAAVTAVGLSPDGKTVASASADSTIRLWNSADGKQIDVLGAHTGDITSVGFSDDGKQLVSSGVDGTVKVWSLPTVAAKVMTHNEAVSCTALSADGTKLVTGTGGKDIKVQLWNLADGKVLKTFAGPKTAITCVAYSNDGAQIAAGTAGNQVFVWKAVDGALMGQLQAHGKAVTDIAFDLKGTQLLTTSADGTLKLWELPLQTGKLLTHPDVVHDAVLSPDKSRLYTAGADKIVHAWDVKSGKEVLQFKDHSGAVTAVSISPDGKLLASAGADSTIRLWNAADGKLVDLLGAHTGAISSVQFNDDGKQLLSSGADGAVKVWSLPTVQAKTITHTEAVLCAALSADGSKLVTGTGGKDIKVQLWNLADGKALKTYAGPKSPVTCVAYSLDGSQIAAGTAGNQVFVWNADDGALLGQLQAHGKTVTDIAFDAKGTQLLTTSADGTLKQWELPLKAGTSFAHPGAVRDAVLSPDKKVLYTAGADKIVHAWDLKTGKESRQFKGHAGPVSAVAVRSDGKLLASAGAGGLIRLWNTADGKQIDVIGAHSGVISSLDFSDDGKQLLSTGADGAVKVWGIPAAPAKVLAQPNPITCAVVSPDGTKLLMGSADKQVRMVSLIDDKKLPPITGPAAITSVNFSANGAIIAVGCADNSAHIYSGATHKAFKLPAAAGAVAISSDGKTLAAGLANNTILLFDTTDDKKKPKELKGHAGAVTGLRFAAKGQRLVSASADKTGRVWNVADGKALLTLSHGAAIQCLELSKDGAKVATGGTDKNIKIWNLADGKALATLATPAAVHSVGFQADGKRLIAGGTDNQVRLYQADGKLLQFFTHQGPVQAVGFLPKGNKLASAGADKAARIWTSTLAWQKSHAGPVHQAIFSAKSTQILSCSEDKSVKLWNAADGKERKTLSGHTAGVVGISVTADGTKIASVGLDKKAILWNSADGKALATFDSPTGFQSVALSQDGTKFAVGPVDKADSVIRVYDCIHNTLLQTISGHTGAVYRLSFQDDNRTLMTAGMDKTARLLDAAGRQVLLGHKGAVTSVAIHPDGVQAITGGDDKTVKLWDLAKGVAIKSFADDKSAISNVAFSREKDGPAQVAASAGNIVHVWSIKDDKEVLNLTHPKTVKDLAFSKDNSQLVTGSDDGQTRIWDVASKRPVQFFQHAGAVAAVGFHPSGKQVISAGADKTAQLWTSALVWQKAHAGPVHQAVFAAKSKQVISASEDKSVKLWNAADGKELKTFAGHATGVLGVAANADGSKIASVGSDKKLIVWNPADGKAVATFDAPVGLQSVAFSEDGAKLAAGPADKADNLIRVYDVAHGKLLQTVPGHAGAVYRLSFQSDGRTLVTAGMDKSARLMDVAGRQVLMGHKGAVTSVAIHPSGTQAITGGDDKTAHLWDLVKGMVIKSFADEKSAIGSVAFSRDKDGPTQIAASADKSVHVWSIKDGKKTFSLTHPKAVKDLAFSIDDSQLVTGCEDGLTRIWDVASKRQLQFFQHAGAVQAVAFHPGGKQVVSASADKTAQLWTSTLLWQQAHAGPVHQAIFAAKSKQVLSCSEDKSVKMWNAADGKELNTLAGHAMGVLGVSANADGSKIATVGQDKKAIVWNPADGKAVATFETAAGLQSIAFSPDGTKLAVGPADKADNLIRVYDTAHGSLLQTLPGHAGAVYRLSFQKDNRTLVSSGMDKTARMLDVAGRQALSGHKGAVTSVAIHPSGTQAVTGGEDKSAQVWDLAKGEVMNSFADDKNAISAVAFSRDKGGPTQIAAGAGNSVVVWPIKDDKKKDGKAAFRIAHPKPVTDLAFSKDNTRIVTGSEDGLTRIWDLGSKRMLQFFQHTGEVQAVAFHPGGKQVVSASADKSARLWTSTLLWEKSHAGPVHQAIFADKTKQVISASADKSVKLWNAADGKEIKTLAGHDAEVLGVSVSADGIKIASVGSDKKAIVWNATDGKQSASFVAPATVQCVAISPDGTKLALGPNDKEKNAVLVYDVLQKQLLQILPNHKGAVSGLAFHADNRTLTTASADKSAGVLDVAGKSALIAHKGAVTGIAIDPKGTQILTGGADKTVKLWDLAKGEVIKSFEGAAAAVTAVAFSRDKGGPTQVAATAEKTVHIWMIKDGKEEITLPHPKGVHQLSFSADGTKLATGSDDGRTRIWDLAGKRELQFFQHEAAVKAVAFHPGGKQVASAGADKSARLWTTTLVWQNLHAGPAHQAVFAAGSTKVVSCSADKSVKLWNTADGKELKDFAGHEGEVRSVSVTTDGKIIASAGMDKKAIVWNAADGKQIAAFATPDPLAGVAISPDGKKLATGPIAKAEGVIRIFDIDGKKPLQILPGHKGDVFGLAFQKDNRTLVTAGKDKTARILDVAGRQVLTGHKGAVTCVAIHPAGSQALTGGEDKSVKLWDLTKGAEIKSFAGAAEAVSSVTFSREAAPTKASATAGKTVFVWNIADGKELLKFEHPAIVKTASFSADNVKLATGAEDGRTRVFDLNQKRELQFFLQQGPITSVAFHNNNTTVVSGSADKSVAVNVLSLTRLIAADKDAVNAVTLTSKATHLLTAGDDKLVKMWNIANGNMEKTFKGHAGKATAVAMSPNDALVVTSGADKTIRVFTVADAKELKAIKTESAVQSLSFSPDSAFFVACNSDNTVGAWDVPYVANKPLPDDFGTLRQSFTHGGPAHRALVLKDNATIFSASGDKTAKSWKLASLDPIKSFSGHTAMVDSAVFSPDGSLLASAGHDGTVRIWDARKLAPVRTINAFIKPLHAVTCLAFSPDGKTLVAGGESKSLVLYNAADGKVVQQFKAFDPEENPKGHDDSIFAVRFSKDGKQIVSAGSGGRILVWNVTDGKVAKEFVDPSMAEGGATAHTNRIYRISFSYTGDRLASTGSAGWLKIWDFASGKLAFSKKLSAGPIYGLSFGTTGEQILTGHANGTANLLEVDLGKE